MKMSSADEWKRAAGGLIGLIIAALILALMLSGCQTVQPTIPEIVYVPTYEKYDPLVKPDEPEWRIPSVGDDADWREWLESMAVDLGKCLDWSAEIEHIIDAWNEANEEGNDQ